MDKQSSTLAERLRFAPRMPSGEPELELAEVLEARDHDDPGVRKNYTDFRDRAAYVYITGIFPTHLRTFFTTMLRQATALAKGHTSLDERSGSLQLKPEVMQFLALEQHPMVKKVREFLADGWKIQVNRGTVERRPYSKVFVFKQYPHGADKKTVKTDGSVKDGWQ